MGTGPRTAWGPAPILLGCSARQNAQATPTTPCRYAAREEEEGNFVNYQREPTGGRRRGRPGGVYIGAGAIVAIAIIVVLIILIF
jgi:hypothetical protein